ncbi:MAG: hypothetical protein JF607_03510 [Burkholderiales bacterium]|nr:hypothetical protein [Burkholderiales bacterium]
MSASDYIAQPTFRTTLDAIQSILGSGQVESIDIAVAYITSGGAHDFVTRARQAVGNAWDGIQKRWVTSFDYCRTEPIALEYISSIPNSSVRIFGADFCLLHGCAPQVPFHPKTFLIKTNLDDFALAGSGNMSRSGLSRGVEAGLVLSVNRANPIEATSAASIVGMSHWFDNTWGDSLPLTQIMLGNYRSVYRRADNLRHPAPTDDDIASTESGIGSLSTKDLQRLRVCESFWIDAGNITKNRGPALPGNQLMMKRLSRVFFGFSPASLPKNSHIGDIDIRINGGQSGMFSLTYSDNKMDKLVLPVPGAGAPAAYDNEYLLFQRWRPGGFELSLGSKAMKNQWLKKSSVIDAAFKMSSGREWGVF